MNNDTRSYDRYDINIDANFRDASGRLISSHSGYIDAEILRPGSSRRVVTSTAGIFNHGKDNLVINGPGSISNFQEGILNREVNGLNISSIILENNDIGYSMTNSTNIGIQQNIIKNNNVGIGSNSSLRVNVVSNPITGNLLTGITFLNSNGSDISMNNIDGSQNSIFLDEQSSDLMGLMVRLFITGY